MLVTATIQFVNYFDLKKMLRENQSPTTLILVSCTSEHYLNHVAHYWNFNSNNFPSFSRSFYKFTSQKNSQWQVMSKVASTTLHTFMQINGTYVLKMDQSFYLDFLTSFFVYSLTEAQNFHLPLLPEHVSLAHLFQFHSLHSPCISPLAWNSEFHHKLAGRMK